MRFGHILAWAIAGTQSHALAVPGSPLPEDALADISAASASPAASLSPYMPVTVTANSKPRDCTRTYARLPSFTHGPIQTVWASVVTVTETIDCHGCQHVAFVWRGGHGPVVFFTTTTTVRSKTRTVTSYACEKTRAHGNAMETSAPTDKTRMPPVLPAVPTPA